MYEELIKKKAFEVEYMFQNDPETDADLFLRERLLLLKKNKQAVPLEELKNRYGKAYYTLCAEIKGAAQYIAKNDLFRGILLKKDDMGLHTVSAIQKMIKDISFEKRCSRILFNRCSYEMFMALISDVQDQIWKIFLSCQKESAA